MRRRNVLIYKNKSKQLFICCSFITKAHFHQIDLIAYTRCANIVQQAISTTTYAHLTAARKSNQHADRVAAINTLIYKVSHSPSWHLAAIFAAKIPQSQQLLADVCGRSAIDACVAAKMSSIDILNFWSNQCCVGHRLSAFNGFAASMELN